MYTTKKEYSQGLEFLLQKARDVILPPGTQDIGQLKKLVSQHVTEQMLSFLLVNCPRLKALHIFTFLVDQGITGKLSSFTALDQLKVFFDPKTFGVGLNQVIKLPNLKSLGLGTKPGSNALSDDALKQISSSLPNLQKLVLQTGKYSREGIQHLTKLKNFKSLGFDSAQLPDSLIQSIIQLLPNLEQIIIHQCQISKPCLMHVMMSLNHLKSVKLWNCRQLQPEDFMKILGKSSQIQELDLSENTMLNDGHLELIGKMKNLYFLELYKCNLIPDHFKTLAKSAVFNLEHFFFDNSKIKTGFDDFIIRQTNLKVLSLPGTWVTDRNLMVIGKHLPNLQYIVLSTTNITSKGYIYLFKLNLRRIHLREVFIPPELVIRHFKNSTVFQYVKPKRNSFNASKSKFDQNQKQLGLRRILD